MLDRAGETTFPWKTVLPWLDPSTRQRQLNIPGEYTRVLLFLFPLTDTHDRQSKRTMLASYVGKSKL